MDRGSRLISVIIPCYQQGNFLPAAIESVLAQTHGEREIVVVDDGSTDGTAEAASRYAGVVYVRQPNRGSAHARNQGLRASKADYLVFLDADDRLLPEALEVGLSALLEHPQCGMTFGRSRQIDRSGALLPTMGRRLTTDDYYLSFLRRCYISNPAAAMFRRAIFDSGFQFNEALPVCSDYDLYLRLARTWPVYCHNQLVSEYRQHAQQKSSNKERMVEAQIDILKSQEPFTRQNRRYESMRAKGIRILRHGYSHSLLTSAWRDFYAGNWNGARRDFVKFVSYDPALAGRVMPWAVFRTCRKKLRRASQRDLPRA
jgi:glycosyltransferase involved in cell wall biosynthesis